MVGGGYTLIMKLDSSECLLTSELSKRSQFSRQSDESEFKVFLRLNQNRLLSFVYPLTQQPIFPFRLQMSFKLS